MSQDTRAIHFDYFQLQGNNLYFQDKEEPLICKDRKLRATAQIVRMLGKEGFHDLGFEIVMSIKIRAQQIIALNNMEEELPSAADIGKSDDIVLQEILEKIMKGMEDIIMQFKGHGKPPENLKILRPESTT